MTRRTEIHRSDWNGILLEITYEPQWMPAHVMGEDLAHIQVRSIHPTDAAPDHRDRLPLALHRGHVAYVDVWLEVEGDSPAWRARTGRAAARPFLEGEFASRSAYRWNRGVQESIKAASSSSSSASGSSML